MRPKKLLQLLQLRQSSPTLPWLMTQKLRLTLIKSAALLQAKA
jgi:hypothetical protein